MNAALPDPSRYLYWATFAGGDPERQIRVPFDLEAHGRGFYFRHPGDQPVSLLRYDRGAPGAVPGRFGPPRGAVLRGYPPPFGGGWRPSDLPDRRVLLGTDCGEPVGYAEARQIAEYLGYEPWILEEPTGPV